MSTLWGPVTRLQGACYHFWHPQPVDETYGHERCGIQAHLVSDYVSAWDDHEAMKKVRFG